jgi:two-component system chemotaxis response regulator CheY
MNILAVDDSHTICQLIEMVLSTVKGFEIDTVEDGQAALDLFQKKHYDLLIVDWMMQPMTGEQLIRAVRHTDQGKTLPIIVLSAEAERELKDTAKAIGATGWMVKPFNPHSLIELILNLPNFKQP